MKWITPLTLAALVSLASFASAAHTPWPDDNSDPRCDVEDAPTTIAGTSIYHCGDFHGEVCMDGAPSQAVDLVLHCATEAPNSVPYLEWFISAMLYSAYQETENDVNYVQHAHLDAWATFAATTDGARDTLDGILCSSVWSGFCTTQPGALLDRPPSSVDDPLGPYPL